MKIDFVSPAVLVKEIKRSKYFYETILGQEIEMDNGEHVGFRGGFSIWEGDHAYGLIFEQGKKFSNSRGQEGFELYFETMELEGVLNKLKSSDVELLHGIHEHPWGQRGFRVYDPDGHIVEVSEPLLCVVRRFRDQGLSIEEISERTSIPADMVRGMFTE